MAQKNYYVDLNLNKNQLKNAVIHPTATAPTGPVDGQVYYDPTASAESFYGRLAGAWVPFLTSPSFDDALFRVYDSGDGFGVKFDVSAVTAADKTITFPDANINLADIATNTSAISTINTRLGTLNVTPTNYTPVGSATVFADHLKGIDVALASAGNNTFDDAVFKVYDDAGDGFGILFDVSAPTADRTITWPDSDVNIGDFTAHLDGGNNKHDASEIDFEKTVATANVTAGSVESAITSLGNAIGTLVQGTNYTASNDQVVASHLTAIDAALGAINTGVDIQGGFDANTATQFPASTLKGEAWYVTVAGTLTAASPQVTLEIGDFIIANTDSASQTDPDDWIVIQSNLQGATELIAGYIAIASQAEVDTGTNDTKAVTPLKLATYIGTTLGLNGKFAVDLADAETSVVRTFAGGQTTYAVTHNLGTEDVIVQIYEQATKESVEAAVDVIDSNQANVIFNGNNTDDTFRVVIIG